MRCAILLIVAGLAGCERSEPPAPNPQQQPVPDAAPQVPASAPAAATRPPVIMIINDQPREFPPARLVLKERNEKTVALLISEDPPEAIDDDYVGNSYYLEMPFDELLTSIRDQVWMFEAPSTDKLNTPNGIFLEGNRRQLQPFQVKVQFQHIGEDDVAWISGTFHQYDTTADPSPPRLVAVTARLVLSHSVK